ncbi:MAG: hypothetical protein D4S01_08530 [Dehalococcoidia bacterium]|nr:MAG: hypothetical protein D4S01_08530 [Dehalococcoidia bacterium]
MLITIYHRERETLNLLLEETADIANAEMARKLGMIILRGDNIIIISPSPR